MSTITIAAPRAEASHSIARSPQASLPRELRDALTAIARRIATITGCREIADDLAQIGLQVACELAPQYEPERATAFLSYVYARARGAMLNTCARERRHRPHDLDDREELLDERPDAEACLAEEEERRARWEPLSHKVEALGDVDRALVRGCVMESRSVMEVSRELGIDYDRARYRLRKVIEALRGGSSRTRR